MAIPSVNMFSNTPGGGIPAAMKAINALREQDLVAKMRQLQNQYYAPNIESEINNRNSLTKGQDISNQYTPEKMQLANEMAKLQNQYYGPNIQSEISHRNALTQGQNISNQYSPEQMQLANEAARMKIERNKNNPFLNQPGAAGEIARLMYLQQQMKNNPQSSGMNQGNNNPMANPGANESFIPSINKNANPLDFNSLIQQQFANVGKSKNARISPEAVLARDYQDAQEGFVPGSDRTQRFSSPEAQKHSLETMERKEKTSQNRKHWDSLPPDTKAHLVAIGQGAGIRGDEVEKHMSSGKDFDDLLYDHGYDPKNPPEPINELTQANRTAQNNREFISREVKYISDFINKATGNYASKVKGYNFNQVKDALAGKNEKQQARYLAARLLSPELINMRLILGGAKGTVHAIKSMTEKAMLDGKIFESLVTNKVWHDTQKIADDELQKAFSASKKGYGQPVQNNPIAKNQIDTAKYDVPEGYITLYKDGKAYFFPPNLVDNKLSKGWSYE